MWPLDALQNLGDNIIDYIDPVPLERQPYRSSAPPGLSIAQFRTDVELALRSLDILEGTLDTSALSASTLNFLRTAFCRVRHHIGLALNHVDDYGSHLRLHPPVVDLIPRLSHCLKGKLDVKLDGIVAWRFGITIFNCVRELEARCQEIATANAKTAGRTESSESATRSVAVLPT